MLNLRLWVSIRLCFIIKTIWCRTVGTIIMIYLHIEFTINNSMLYKAKTLTYFCFICCLIFDTFPSVSSCSMDSIEYIGSTYVSHRTQLSYIRPADIFCATNGTYRVNTVYVNDSKINKNRVMLSSINSFSKTNSKN